MQRLLLTVAAAGMFGFGLAAVNPVFAGPTADQAAAESDLPAAAPATPPGVSARGEGVIVPGEPTTGPGDASNGMAQSRIAGGEQLQQNGE